MKAVQCMNTAIWNLKWWARWKLNLSSSTFWLLDQSPCNAFLLAVCQRSGETCCITTLSCVKDFEEACNKSCKLSIRVHETRGFGAEVVTQGKKMVPSVCIAAVLLRGLTGSQEWKYTESWCQESFFKFTNGLKYILLNIVCDMCLIKRVKHKRTRGSMIKAVHQPSRHHCNHHCKDEDFRHHHTGWLDICQNSILSTLASFKVASYCRCFETWSRQTHQE